MSEDLKARCIELEHFETPKWAVDEILKREILTRWVIDPCAGAGILSIAAGNLGHEVISYDIHDWTSGIDGEFELDGVFDFIKPGNIYTIPNEFSVLMNPPFSKAVEFVEKSLELGARKVVCFQRFAWWESKKRRDFWAKHPPARIYICGDRADCWRHI